MLPRGEASRWGATPEKVYRPPAMVRTRLTRPRGGPGWAVERVVWLTPYAADEIAEDARRAGPGARLEVTVPKSTGADGVAAVVSLFGWLREKGVEVIVQLGDADS